MYFDFYGFREKPFNMTPDPRFIYLSRNHREAFAHLLYGINSHAGFIVLTGEVGTGKTTVLRTLLGQLDADHYRTALIFNPSLSPPQLLRCISRELGISSGDSNDAELHSLNQFLLRENMEGRTVILVIDEAQNLNEHVLEQIRLISNLETDSKKLIQIVLAGQPELSQILKKKQMRQLDQRISVRYHLLPMDLRDTTDYINHRLEVAGGRAVFSRRAMRNIFRYSRGFPRLVNAACDRVLLTGYTRNSMNITPRIAAAGIKELRVTGKLPAWKRRRILIPSFMVLAFLAAAAIVYLSGPESANILKTLHPVESQNGVAVREESSGTPAAELWRMSERESARRAFNVLAGLWNVPPVSAAADLNRLPALERAALDRGLRLYKFSGNIGTLMRIDCAAILELNLPGESGKRFITLTGMEKEYFLAEPSLAEGRLLSGSELEKFWSGHGYILWKNSLHLPSKILPGSGESRIRRLQNLLREAGTYRRPSTGVYDAATRSAVKAFQASKGMEPTGVTNARTLMLLYQSVDRFSAPKLNRAAPS